MNRFIGLLRYLDFVEVLESLCHGSLDLERSGAGMGVDLALGVDRGQVFVVDGPLIDLPTSGSL